MPKYMPVGADWIRDEWIPALRGGEYTQGKHTLHAIEDGKHTFCCLGVACDIRQIESDVREGDMGIIHEYTYMGTRQLGALPKALADEIGITIDGIVSMKGDTDKYTCLTQMNDGGESFDQIADIIEACIDPDDDTYRFVDPRMQGVHT